MALNEKEAAAFEKAGHKLHTCNDCGGAGALYGSYLSRLRLNCEGCQGEVRLFGCPVPTCTAKVARYDLNPFEGEKPGGICDPCAAEAKSVGMSRTDFLLWMSTQQQAVA